MAVIDISRDDILIILESMGIKLDKDNKIPMDQLEVRLDKALDASQRVEELDTLKSINPDKYALWNPTKSLFQATARYSAAEALQAGSITRPKKAENARKEDTFKELRQTIWGVAFACEEDAPAIFLVNKDQQNAIFIRVLGVHELPSQHELQHETPLFHLAFAQITPTPEMSLGDHIRILSNGKNGELLPVGTLESYLILRLLRKNAKRLDHGHRHFADQNMPNKVLLTSSFLLPLDALTQQTLGAKRLSDNGCYVCGNKISSRCQACLAVSYCSKECQRKDWNAHKSTCKSLRGHTWHHITLGDISQIAPHAEVVSFSEFGSGGFRSKSKDDPANGPHQGKIFLAKFQVPLTFSKPTQMLVYDHQRSIQKHWYRSSGSPELFDKAVSIIGQRMKFYRWMRYVGGDQYDICLEGAPPEDPRW